MLKKLRRLANVLFWMVTVALFALPLAAVVYVIMTAPTPSDAATLFPQIGIVSPPPAPAFWAAIAVGALSFLLFVGFLVRLRHLFEHYRKGQILTAHAAQTILSLGKWLFALAILRFLTTPIQTILLTSGNPIGQRQVSISISDHEVGFFMVAGLLTLIGWAMKEAARVSAENEAFI